MQENEFAQTVLPGEAKKRFIDLIAKRQKQIEGLLAKQFDFARYGRLVLVAMERTPKLAQCTPISVINSVMTAASMGLEIRDRQAYLVPFHNGKANRLEATLIVDYRGKIELARRGGHVEDMEARMVYAKDRLTIVHGLESKFEHIPLLYREANGALHRVTVEERGDVVLGYGVAWLKNSSRPHVEPMSFAEIEAIRRRSKSAFYDDGNPKRDSAWTTDWDQMARKTVIHRLFNYTPNTREMALSQEIDDRVELEIPLDPIIEPESEDDEKPLVQCSREEQNRVLEARLVETGTDAEHAALLVQERVAKQQNRGRRYPVLKEFPAMNTVGNGQRLYVNGKLYEYVEDRSAFEQVQEPNVPA